MLWFKQKTGRTENKALAYTPKNISSVSYITEALKGLVSTKKIKFPLDLGEEHPFDFSVCERIAIKYGVVSAIVDKHIDFIMSGGIFIESKNEKAKQIIEMFMKDFNFDTLLRNYLREAFIKGNGFMEIGYDKDNNIDALKILDANWMYVIRDEYGEIKGYNQYSKALKDWTNYQEMMNKADVIKFETKEIVHLPVNIYGDKVYGYGMIYQLISIIDDLLCSRKEMHTLMKRKANNPLIFLMGDREKGEFPTVGEIEAFGQKLELLHNQTEWALSDMVKPIVLDFGSISEKFNFIIENDLELLYMAAQIPAILMGKASVAEGLGVTQEKAWMHRINSLREDVEKVIENNIFKRILINNGIDAQVEIVWGLPSESEKNEKAKIIISALQNPFMNEGLREGMEVELAKIFNIEEEELETPEEERKFEEEEETQPVIPEEKTKSRLLKEKVFDISIKDEYEHFDNMQVEEWIGFNYKKYKENILNVVNTDKFEDLRGYTKTDFKAGLLNNKEIEKMKNVFYEAFDKNYTIREIKSELQKNIEFKDRLRMKDNNLVVDNEGNYQISVAANKRAIMIARTETIRLSGLGAIENYKEHDINKIRWTAAMSDRTCPICLELNGQIFPINNIPPHPAHTFCRCALSPVVRE